MYTKTIVLAVLLWIVSVRAVAQLSYWGTAGGQFRLQTQEDAQFSSTSIAMELDIGLFLLENIMLGGGFSVSLHNQRPIRASKQQNSLLRTGNHLFARYYIPATDELQLFVGSKFNWQRFFIEEGNIGLGTSTNEEFSQISLTAGLGANYFLHKDLAFEAAFFLHFLDARTPTPPTPLTTNLLDFSLGLRYFPQPRSTLSRRSSSNNVVPPALRQKVWTVGGAFQIADQPLYGFTLQLSPDVSYFPIDRLSLGLRSGITARFDSAAHQVSLGGHTRYHFGRGNTYCFVGGGVQLLQLENPGYRVTNPSEQDISNSLQLLATYGIGIGTFLSANTAIEGQLEYQHNLYHRNRPDFSSIQATVGLRYYWPYEKL